MEPVTERTVYYGPCGNCGLVHGGWQDCADTLTASGRIALIEQYVRRVSARGNIVDPQDVGDLTAVLLLCDDKARRADTPQGA